MFNNSRIIRDGICGPGSVGGFFTMGNSDQIYGITNNHVAANLNNCNVGDAILFEEDRRAIGFLSHWVILKTSTEIERLNQIDVALFRLNPNLTPRWIIGDRSLPGPLGFIEPRQGGRVYMASADGRHRSGRITKTYTNHVLQFYLCGRPFLFTRLVEVTPISDSPFSQGGDSGSVVFSSNHYIVGIILGANSDRTRSYLIPFVDGILNRIPLRIY